MMRKDALKKVLEICHDENRDPWERLAEIEGLIEKALEDSKFVVETEIPELDQEYCNYKCYFNTGDRCQLNLRDQELNKPGPNCPQYQREKGEE